jgi:hypothetical protein
LFFCKICQKSVNFEKMYLIVVGECRAKRGT